LSKKLVKLQHEDTNNTDFMDSLHVNFGRS